MPDISMSEFDARFLREIAETDGLTFGQRGFLHCLADDIYDAILVANQPEPEILLPGPDGEPNESVPVDFFG